MTPGVEAFPLTWPAGWKRTNYRERSRFKVTPGRARDQLFEELRRLGANKIILSTNIELRQDGLPYCNRRAPADPGVAVYFQHKGRPMVFACDQWISVEENMWAIMHTIDALRGIERWSASDMLERAFTGFQALPSGEKKTWWEVLGVPRNASQDQIRDRFRQLAREHHPDHGGQNDEMTKLNDAYSEGMHSACG